MIVFDQEVQFTRSVTFTTRFRSSTFSPMVVVWAFTSPCCSIRTVLALPVIPPFRILTCDEQVASQSTPRPQSLVLVVIASHTIETVVSDFWLNRDHLISLTSTREISSFEDMEDLSDPESKQSFLGNLR